MQKEEYSNIYNQESRHFFYVGNHLLILNLIKRFAGNNGKLQILDAGCGTGMLAVKLLRFGKVMGIDVSHEAVKFSRKRGVDVKRASITKLPFKNHAFDLVVSVDVLYHQWVKNDLQALLEIKRVLKPGGILILKVPAHNWLRGSHDLIVLTRERYTTTQLKRLVAQAGLKTLQASYFASFLLPLAIVKRLIESVSHPGQAVSDVSSPPVPVNSIFIFFYKLESFLLKFVSIPFGLSVFVVAQKTRL